jgi:DNA-directed RNA polymerase specialized sigma subunit
VAQDGYYLAQAGKDLQSELGREPTDSELADKTGLSFKRMHKVRQYHAPVSEGQIVDPETGMSGYSGAINNPWQQKRHSAWTQMVYDDLDPYHQQVMEHTLGMNGRRVASNADLAKKLGKSPGAISQAKARIQTFLDQGEELSPFGVA